MGLFWAIYIPSVIVAFAFGSYFERHFGPWSRGAIHTVVDVSWFVAFVTVLIALIVALTLLMLYLLPPVPGVDY